MKSTKKELDLKILLLAALLTAFLIDLLGSKLGIATWLFVSLSSPQPLGHPESSILMYGLTLGLNLLAGLPVLWLLKHQGVKHYSAIAMLAVTEASLLFFTVSSVVKISGWIWFLVMFGLLLVSYYLTGGLYNRLSISNERKTIVVLLILGITLALFVMTSLG